MLTYAQCEKSIQFSLFAKQRSFYILLNHEANNAFPNNFALSSNHSIASLHGNFNSPTHFTYYLHTPQIYPVAVAVYLFLRRGMNYRSTKTNAPTRSLRERERTRKGQYFQHEKWRKNFSVTPARPFHVARALKYVRPYTGIYAHLRSPALRAAHALYET